MSAHPTFALRFGFGAPLPIRSVADVRTALGRTWPRRDTPRYLRARELCELAQAGYCRPQVAIEALVAAAAEQGLLHRHRASDAIDRFDSLFTPSKDHARWKRPSTDWQR